MIIEKWALPFFKKAGFQPATASTAARTDIECACCQLCNQHGGYEPINSESPFLDKKEKRRLRKPKGCVH
eukprot:1142670-Pelagomonas_calceolata.AAC.2